MSGDYNSVISSAINAAEKRRTAAVANSSFTTAGVTQSTNSVTELSVEDLAGAMKSRGARRHEDNQFIEKHNSSSFIKRHEKEDVGVVGTAQDTISAAHKNAVQAIDRQTQVFNSLRNFQKDPYAK